MGLASRPARATAGGLRGAESVGREACSVAPHPEAPQGHPEPALPRETGSAVRKRTSSRAFCVGKRIVGERPS